MLKNIHLHVDVEESRQHAVEQQAAEFMASRKRQNISALQRYMPNLLQYLQAPVQSSVSLLCNKHGEINLIDYQSGRVFYSEFPRQEAQRQVQQFAQNPLYVPLAGTVDTTPRDYKLLHGLDSPVAHRYRSAKPVAGTIEVLVVLGLGLGYHIEELIKQYDIRHLIIYEPEPDRLKYSLTIADWKAILQQAQSKHTGIYLQAGNSGADLSAHIRELSEHVNIEGFYLYQHYPDRVFNQLAEMLATHTWQDFSQLMPGSVEHRANENYVSVWQGHNQYQQWSTEALDTARFNDNIAAFRQYFPAMAKEFENYTPLHWQPMANAEGEVNVFHKNTLAGLYSDHPRQDCNASLQNFARRPHKDSLVLGYSGNKLRSYLHYQLVEKVQHVLNDLEETKGELPATIRSMIMFGMGVGYQLPSLYTDYQVEKLFICEPNRDYFFASLYAIDWAAILKQIDDNDGRIYLNIGDDGSNLVHDLLMQFHTIGPYVLASTYFYQSYHNDALSNAIVQLREQLRVIISMGDYFDHSRYGIAHTQWAIKHNTPFLKAAAKSQLSQEMRETPVFIIGNGPSLDALMPLVKEYQHRAIVISCGTALQSLHRNGITPHFHAEIETNRATFDWACRVGDFDYLKQISLLSCNGMHPDTCELYKDVFFAFKEGESATVSITELYPKHEWAVLGKAYPTVTNFAIDFITQAGFEQLYLFGTDMGFVDKNHHHSKASGYYENGQPTYDYSKENNTSLVIPGNLRPWVNTKYEFKVSKSVIEQALAASAVEAYNLNDGAKIAGANALPPENLLVLSSENAVTQTLHHFKQHAFETIEPEGFADRFHQRYRSDKLAEELAEFRELVQSVPQDRAKAHAWVEQQRQFTIDSFKQHQSLLYFYLTGTVNYINSALMKTLNITDEALSMQAFGSIASAWNETLEHIEHALTQCQYHFDGISSYPRERRVQLFQKKLSHMTSFQIIPARLSRLNQFISLGQSNISPGANPAKVCQKNILFIDDLPDPDRGDWVIGRADCIVVKAFPTLEKLLRNGLSHRLIYLPGDFRLAGHPVNCNDMARVTAAAYIAMEDQTPKVVVPLLGRCINSLSEERFFDTEFFNRFHAYRATDQLWFTAEELPSECHKTILGERLSYIHKLSASDFSTPLLTPEKFMMRWEQNKSLLEEVK
ncbi:motility associated factor glycosyltransferase family protein [Salinimonas marina]|uniref:Motility associated factor glycosyltransferase family protein n=1 Tax=Salinimonas marina TaxID=2785918 RepID=A0A7S9DVZ1_9ALTE|nr:6-hydroxymethylpterin diphosphokinase MptE-like protein [Salinimonas marina]QPG04961.1 motility associated factor glycosyltransferase family protein [Salinimonas marina]